MPERKRVTSVVEGNNDLLIAAAARLWIKRTDRVLDPTYGDGKFWKLYRPRNFVMHDLYKLDGVDCRKLPHDDNSFDVEVLDLPYVSVGGRETSTIDDMNDAYDMLDSEMTPAAVDELIFESMVESRRVLDWRGRLMVKTMDYVSSGKYHQGRHHTVESAQECGFRQVDEIVLIGGTGPQPLKNLDGTPRQQVHTHRAHSLLCIFQTTKRKSRKTR